MKGVVFILVEEFVTEQFGADAWDALLEESGLDGVWTTLGSYPDEQLGLLVQAATKQFDLPAEQVQRLVGQGAFAGLAAQYPYLLEQHDSCRTVLLDLNGIIHPEVMKLYPGAQTPEFEVTEQDDGLLHLRYRSPRALGPLAEGLVAGAAAHFGESVEFLSVTDRGVESEMLIRIESNPSEES
ncbi:MAG: heme NO-binding domain-containing protein [Microthrixaceae bacterium]